MAGALALIVAGFGSVAISSNTDPTALAHSNYQTISAYTGSDAGSDGVDVTRDFDRKAFARQTKVQVDSQQRALAEQVSLVQKSADKLKSNQWVLPVAGYHLTARFGQRSSLWSTVHTGLDFAGPSGTTIISVGAGTVKSADYEGAYGNRTVITLLDGTDIWYCHQSRIAVRPGMKVTPGQVIGYTGATGNVTGPHLHLEVHPGGGAAVDPYPVLVAHRLTP
jgi:murein DD-endopeptidase MepM/ murein hydrolase activator NlpD